MPLGLNRPQTVLLGVNHNTAPVEVRERLSLSENDTPALRLFAELPSCKEVVFLSTCNRVEVLVSTNRPDEVRESIKGLWLDKGKMDSNTLQGALYEYEGMSAIRHLFRVASSLDSMVVGEPQILGQLKDAYRMASEAKTAGMVLNRLLHKAFSVAKRIRTETRIASHAVSISYAAVELAKKIFGDLAGKNGMLIGAGEMAELAAQHLIAGGADKLVVANRTLSRAVYLAQSLGGSAISLEEVGEALVDADIVISSTGAPGIILRKDQVKRIMRPRRHRLLFFIDIAVPRDIDPKVNDIDNVYLYDIDDLKGVIEFNKAEREKEASKADRMVEAEVIKFMAWMESLNVVPVIQHLQEKGEAVRQKEISRSHKVLESLNDEQQKALDVLTRSIVQKILQDPIISIKKEAQERNSEMILDAACRLFGIDGLKDTQSQQAKGISDNSQDKTM
ncbi:MAG: glutamyl-tRNA reductase [Thermodesulfobacteriota bacterium]|nr:glutamyl-tRNA reductase [Thermodesulfobacteriota bacterium]